MSWDALKSDVVLVVLIRSPVSNDKWSGEVWSCFGILHVLDVSPPQRNSKPQTVFFTERLKTCCEVWCCYKYLAVLCRNESVTNVVWCDIYDEWPVRGPIGGGRERAPPPEDVESEGRPVSGVLTTVPASSNLVTQTNDTLTTVLLHCGWKQQASGPGDHWIENIPQ